MDYSKLTLGYFLSHEDETIRRNAMSIYKRLIAIDKKVCLHYLDGLNKCEKCGEKVCRKCFRVARHEADYGNITAYGKCIDC